MDLPLLLTTLESVAGADPFPHLRAKPRPTIRQQHFFDAEDLDNIDQPPCLGLRTMTPFEACYLYAQGKFDCLGIPVEADLRSQRLAVPNHARAALRLAQTLTVAANFDHTFSIAHLSARDLMMIDAFLREDIYTLLRDKIVGEATTPTASTLSYPCIRDLPILEVVQSLKGLHAATLKLTTYRLELFTEVDQWESPEKVIDALEYLATLLYNLDHRRAVLDMHITPFIAELPEDIRNFADMLSHHNASPHSIQIIYNAANAELTHAYNLHQALTERLRRLCCPDSLQYPHADVPNTPPAQTLQGNAWTPATTVPTFTTSFSHTTAAVDTVVPELPSYTYHIKPQSVSLQHAAPAAEAVPTSVTASAAPKSDVRPVEDNPYLFPETTPVDNLYSASSSVQYAEQRYRKMLETQPATATDIVGQSSSASSSTSDARASRSEENPYLFPDLSSIRRRFSRVTPSQYAKQQFRRALESQARALHAEASTSASTSSVSSNAPPASSPIPALPKDFSGCLFCTGDHYTASCKTIKSLIARCTRIAHAGRCFKCLYLHPPGQCQREKPCNLCNDEHHHPAFCFRNRHVINDVAGDLFTYYKGIRDLAEAKYKELYMAPRQ